MFDNDNYNEEDFIKIALNKIYIIKKFFSDNLNEKKIWNSIEEKHKIL